MTSSTRAGQQTFLVLLLITVALVPYHVLAQVSVTQSTAGIDPNTQNPTFPAGLNGLSTGSTAQFTNLGTAPTPNIPRPTNTLTGEALSAFEASIATNFAQASGSDFMYTSTTGGLISGVGATLSGGYNEQAPGQSSVADASSVASPLSSTQAASNGGSSARTSNVNSYAVMTCLSVSLAGLVFGVSHVL